MFEGAPVKPKNSRTDLMFEGAPVKPKNSRTGLMFEGAHLQLIKSHNEVFSHIIRHSPPLMVLSDFFSFAKVSKL